MFTCTVVPFTVPSEIVPPVPAADARGAEVEPSTNATTNPSATTLAIPTDFFTALPFAPLCALSMRARWRNSFRYYTCEQSWDTPINRGFCQFRGGWQPVIH